VWLVYFWQYKKIVLLKK